MSKSTKSKAGAASPVVTDIPHEEVKHENGVSHVAKVISTEDQIKLELAKFNIADSAIEQMKETYGGLTISGPEDKAGYKAVREAWRETQSTRTKLQKKGLELRNGYGVITKAIKKEEDRLVELISPLEDNLYEKWKSIDEEKDRLRAEAEAEEQRQLMIRVEEVLGLGMVFKDGFYQVGDTISMDVATLRALPLDQYEKLKSAIVARVEEIVKIKAEEEAEKKRQAEQLQREKDELARQQEEMRKEREEMQRQRDEIAKQQAEAKLVRIENRVNKLLGLGMFRRDFDLKFDNGFQGFTIADSQISYLSDSDFADLVSKAAETINIFNKEKADHEEKVNQEKAAKAEKEKFIAEKMSAAGMVYDYNSKSFRFKNDVKEFIADWSILMPLSESDLIEMANGLADGIVKARAESTRLQKEREAAAEKEAKLGMTEKQLFASLLNDLEICRDRINSETFKSKLWSLRANQLQTNLSNLIKEFQ